MKQLLVILTAVVLAALSAPAALAHEEGKAQPRIAAALSDGEGLERTLTVELADADGGAPVPGATVVATARMTSPHIMRMAPWALPQTKPGTYRARIRFLMPADWEIDISVTGDAVVEATSTLPVEIRRSAPAGEAQSEPAIADPAGDPALTVLPARVEDAISSRDIWTMILLWVHGLASVGWILGVLLMVVALSERGPFLADGARRRLSSWYREWGAWLHWGFVPLIVLTGVYNMLYVTPFPIAWKPSQLSALASVPYGPLYEAILVVKLGLFAALLITGTQVLLRTIRPSGPPALGRGALGALRAALGPSGVAYLVCVPLVLAAAVALRYIHVLSHVAEVIAER